MKVACPNCRHIFNVVTRAPMCKGTQRRDKLNLDESNKMAGAVNGRSLVSILWALAKPSTVRDVQRVLYEQTIKRWRKGDKAAPSGEWNYHDVQALLSILVGSGYVKMTTAKEKFNTTTARFEAKPVPRYYIEKEKAGTQ